MNIKCKSCKKAPLIAMILSFLMLFSPNGDFFQIFYNFSVKSACIDFEFPYNAHHTTTRCCEVRRFAGASLFFAL
ncbi:hypothetical protein BKG96_11045 [Rodentibacter caecimuris]|uniref:Secreted protein n=1 Tax=Rodentibacter caecimuris TaxID=1796644 RepID=A0A1V3KDE7_9PAST|nr:hypothetical protein BKG96_11045 [Rodentibacter heylii]